MGGGNNNLNNSNNSNLASKQRLRWTNELHERFVDAVAQLGGPDSKFVSFFIFSSYNDQVLIVFFFVFSSRIRSNGVLNLKLSVFYS